MCLCYVIFFFYLYGDHRDLHLLPHSFPTRRSSDPAIVQDADNQRVLMLGWMSREALQVTLDTGWVTFHSRSRGRLWTKGETSGHGLALVSIEADCDGDTLLLQARQQGPTCHLGRASC